MLSWTLGVSLIEDPPPRLPSLRLFPKLVELLDHWTANLKWPLYRVRVAQITPQEFRFSGGEVSLAPGAASDFDVM